MRRFALFVLLVLLPVTARAQFDTATVLGTATDPSRAVLPHCLVTLHNTATDARVTATTDERGAFRFVDVAIGPYEMKVTAPGFQPAASTFELTVGARQRVDVQLQVASETTQVTATFEASQLETESSDRGQVINNREIAELPLNGREYSQLVELAPGVVPSPSELGTNHTQREGSFDVNGLRSVFNNYLLDGLDNNFYGTSNQGFSNQVVQLSPDAVEEFRVVTNNESAEYGRAGGATINVVTRYGTNQFHGRIWEFIRNTALDASGYFPPNVGGKPSLQQNQFGATLSGPLHRDQLFFFVDRTVHFAHQCRARPHQHRRAPRLLPDRRHHRQKHASDGYFAGRQPLPLRRPERRPRHSEKPVQLDHLPRNRPGGGGTHYLNGHIPASAVINYASSVLALLPANTNSNLTNNYIVLDHDTVNRDKGDAKLDYDVRENLHLFARYSQSRFDAFDPGSIAGVAGSNGDGHVYAPMYQIVGGATWTISPKALLEARFGFSQMKAGKTPPLAGGPSMAQMFGITVCPPVRSTPAASPTSTPSMADSPAWAACTPAPNIRIPPTGIPR
jgi:hypothetical protein